MKPNTTIKVNAEAACIVLALKKYIKVGNWLSSVFPECDSLSVTAVYQGNMISTAKLQQQRSDLIILEANKLVPNVVPVLPVIKTHKGWWEFKNS